MHLFLTQLWKFSKIYKSKKIKILNPQIPITSLKKKKSTFLSILFPASPPNIFAFLCICHSLYKAKGFPGGSTGKESTCKVGDLVSISRLGRSFGEGKGYPFQHSDLENSRDCIAHGVTKGQTQLSNFHFLSFI